MPRRHVSTAVAWTSPAVALAAAAPVEAASPGVVTCPATQSALMSLQAGSSLSLTTRTVGNGTYPGGTYFGLNLGQWNVNPASSSTGPVTGYHLLFGGCGYTSCAQHILPASALQFPVTNGLGASYVGKVSLATPVGCSPQVAGAGLAVSVGIQTSIPYYSGADSCQVFGTGALSGALQSVSIPFTIIYLDGLTPVLNSAGASCCYRFNATLQTTGCIGTEPITSWSITAS